MKARLRLAQALSALVLAAAALAGAHGSAPASADAATRLPQSAVGDCMAAGKVWLLVVTDGGSTKASLCVGKPSSGLQALSAVGYSQVPGQDGAVCTIGGYPSACAWDSGQYWSYWTATPGGSWTYSQKGAGNRTPPAKSIEGWCYTKKAPAAVQKNTCIGQLNAKLSPGSIVIPTAAPTSRPPTAKPTTAAPKPTTAAPKPSATSRPATSAPKPGTSKPTATPVRPSAAQASSTKPSSVATSRTSQPGTGQPTTSKAGTASKNPSSSSQSSSGQPSSKQPSSKQSSATQPASGSAKPSSSASSASPAQTTVPVATVPSAGSPFGVIATAGVIALGAAGAGVYLWKGRKP